MPMGPPPGLRRPGNYKENDMGKYPDLELIECDEIVFQTENGLDTLLFKENDNEEHSFMLQYQQDDSPPKNKEGWSNYFLGLANGNIGSYACITKVHLSPKALYLVFNNYGKPLFELPGVKLKPKSPFTAEVSDLLEKWFKYEPGINFSKD